PEIQPPRLAAWLDAARGENLAAAGSAQRPPLVLDVREDWEVAICRLPGSLHIPMREIPSRLAEIDLQRPVVCLCHHGGRSAQVAMFLEHQGAREVYNLTGGIDGWARQVDPSCPTY